MGDMGGMKNPKSCLPLSSLAAWRFKFFSCEAKSGTNHFCTVPILLLLFFFINFLTA